MQEQPIDIYNKIQAMVQKEIDDKISAYADVGRYNPRPVPDHHHDGVGSSTLDYASLDNRIANIAYTLVDSTTNTSVTSTIGGDFVMPFDGVIIDVSATVDTAGTTNDTIVDIKKNGTSIFNTLIHIDSGEKTSRTAGTHYEFNKASNLNLLNFTIGDIFTFSVTQISTTAAKGLKVYMTTNRS